MTTDEANPARMPARRVSWPVSQPLPFDAPEREWREAMAYRRMMIEERGVSYLTAEFVVRSVVWLRDGGRCRYCGRPVELRRTGDIRPEDRMTFDHVVPASRGGAHSYANVWTCCLSCNRIKDGMTLDELDAWLVARLVDGEF